MAFVHALPVKSHVDKEAFFEQELPGILQKQQVSRALALHLLLPELALLLLNSTATAYHCSILKSILSIVAFLSSTPDLSYRRSSNPEKGNNTLPLRLFEEVLRLAFDSSDRAMR